MERLTEKAKIGYREKDNDYSIKVSIQKLGKLEDIEEELGIPLEVMFKALKDGIYYFNYRYDEIKYARFTQFYFNQYHGWALNDGVYSVLLKLKDYGKTWSLTREELENAKD